MKNLNEYLEYGGDYPSMKEYFATSLYEGR